jgi:hypothetical protein
VYAHIQKHDRRGHGKDPDMTTGVGSPDVVTLRDTPPFRADHVGSLLRPANLLKARAQHAVGRGHP